MSVGPSFLRKKYQRLTQKVWWWWTGGGGFWSGDVEEVGFGGGSSGVRMREKWGCRNRASENVSQRHLFLCFFLFLSEMRCER